jgi:hypothetical protein
MKTITTILLLLSLFTKAQVVQIEDMIEGRNGHTASFVNMEGVIPGALVCGGYDGFNVLESAEWYEGQIDSWSSLTSMSYPRVDHAATSYDNGNYVLVTGGWNGFAENYASTEIFNALTGEWSDGPDMSSGRSSHVATLLEDVNGIDYVLVTGGFDGISEIASCERLNLNTMLWENAGTMNTGRSSHTLTKLNDGRYLVTGGFNAAEGFQLSSCEIYDPITNNWSAVQSMADTRDHHAAVLLYDGKVLVAGGRRFNSDLNLFEGMIECEYYNPTTDEWTTAPVLAEPQSYHHMLYNADSYYLLAGAVDHTGIDVTITYSVSTEYFHPQAFWFASPDPIYPEGRFKYAMVRIPEGILVCGGENGDSTGELYTTFVSHEEKISNNFSYFPNPVDDKLFLEAQDVTTVEIFSTDGRMVLNVTAFENYSIDVSQLSTGIYTLRVVTDTEIQTEKLIVK